MLYILDANGKQTWASNVKDLLMRYGFGHVWANQGVGDVNKFIQIFKERVQDCYKQDWNSSTRDLRKLSVYCTFKSILEPERYLECLNVRKYLSVYSRFRCSSHMLEIEQGRHNCTPMEDRICKLCETKGKTVIEDEYHFLLNCPSYESLRQRYIPDRYRCNASYSSFIEIMSTNSDDLIKNVAYFIKGSINLRSKILKDSELK